LWRVPIYTGEPAEKQNKTKQNAQVKKQKNKNKQKKETKKQANKTRRRRQSQN